MTTWPVTLPSSPQINSLSGGPVDDILRTANDAGPSIKRNRFTGVVYKYQFTLMMSLAQLNILHDFWRDDIGKGSMKFDFPDPVFGTTREFSFSAGWTIQSIAAVDYYLVPMSIESEAVV